MKNLYWFRMICFITMAGVANVSHAQNYDSVVIEKKYFNPDIDNLFFKRNKSFNYKISISDSTKTYDICILKNGEIRKIETKSTGTDSILAKLKIVSFKIIKPGFLKRTNKFQSELRIDYQFSSNIRLSSWTGLVENKSNIWFHPARNNGLETLELAPFPYIQYPLRENKIWRDALKISNHWSNFTAMNWKDSLVNQFTYVISGKKLIEYNNNKISCWIIDAKGSNRIGESSLTSYFNEELGFIKLEYRTIENKQIVFTLRE